MREGERCLPRGGDGCGVDGRKERKERKKRLENNNIIIWPENRLFQKNPQKYPEVENVILRNNTKSAFQNKIPFSN